MSFKDKLFNTAIIFVCFVFLVVGIIASYYISCYVLDDKKIEVKDDNPYKGTVLEYLK